MHVWDVEVRQMIVADRDMVTVMLLNPKNFSYTL